MFPVSTISSQRSVLLHEVKVKRSSLQYIGVGAVLGLLITVQSNEPKLLPHSTQDQHPGCWEYADNLQ